MTTSRGEPEIAAVAFDLMGTVLYDPFREAIAAGTPGMTLDELRRARGVDAWPRFERGELTEAEFWALHEDVGIEVDREAFHQARRSGYRFLPGMRRLVDDVRAVVTAVAATNYPRWIDELAAGMLSGCFDEVYASADLGVRKPDPAYYERLLGHLGLSAGRVAFVDDRPDNVTAAAEIGMYAITFDGADALRAELRELGLDC